MDINYYKSLEPLFGSWHITELIGEGSFGKVFEIERRDETFGKCYKAALKVISIPQNKSEITSLKSEGLSDEEATAYFKDIVNDVINEYDIMVKLKGNSHIVSCEDYITVKHEDNIGWDILIRMELLTPLVKVLEKVELGENQIIKLGIDLCRALESCQRYNIIHRDIKPENIFVSELGEYKLGDFGIARTQEKTSTAMSRKGTGTYMAPEVYNGQSYGRSVDIYSIGVVMYRLLNKNRAPFFPPYPNTISYADKENALMRRMKGETIPLPINGCDELKRIVMKACSFAAKDRYASPEEMRRALERIETLANDSFAEEKTVILEEEKTESLYSVAKHIKTEPDEDDDKTLSIYASEPVNENISKAEPANENVSKVEPTRESISINRAMPFEENYYYEEPIEEDYEKDYEEDYYEEPEKKGKSWILIVALIAFVGIIMVMGNLKNAKKSTKINYDRSNLMFIKPFDRYGNPAYGPKIENNSYVYDEEYNIVYVLRQTIDELDRNGAICLTGNNVAKAQVERYTLSNEYVVDVTFDNEGKEILSKVTKELAVDRYSMAVYYDGEFLYVPIINSTITSGKIQIAGFDTKEEAQQFADYLNGKGGAQSKKSGSVQRTGEDGYSSSDSYEEYKIDSMTMNIGEPGRTRYCVADISLYLDRSNKDYIDISPYDELIRGEILAIFSEYSSDDVYSKEDEIRKEILERLQRSFDSDFIYDVKFRNLIVG